MVDKRGNTLLDVNQANTSFLPTNVRLLAGAGRSALALSWRITMLELTLSVRITIAQVIKILQILATIIVLLV